MKRTFLLVSLCMLVGFSFAQKKAVKDAKSAMNSNVDEARELIKPALTNPETANDQETWKVAGDIEYKAFETEKANEMTKDLPGGKPADEVKMYTGLYNMYDPYIKADELGQLPDEKGKVKNKVRKDITRILKEAHPFYINGGIYYNDKKDFSKAADFFEKYWMLPELDFFKGDTDFRRDSTYQTIKYYAIISAIQAKDHPRSIRLLKKIISEPYIDNGTYKESDTYELLSSEYQVTGDSVAYVATLREGAQKFPKNQYFTPNLINEYIKGGKMSEALDYIDQAIASDPSNACDLYSVKASLYAEKKEYTTAASSYADALKVDAKCERALEGQGVLFVLQAQDVKEKAGQTTNRKEQAELDKQTADLYQKSLPYLENYVEILKARNADAQDIKQGLTKLQNVYYNLSLLNIDKSKELDAIEKELSNK
ncbi:MAG: hypothetical protein QM660_07975 [Dysgonomonas sp.]